MATTILAKGVKEVAVFTTRIAKCLAKWPMLSGIFSYIFIIVIIASFFALIVLSLYLLLLRVKLFLHHKVITTEAFILLF